MRRESEMRKRNQIMSRGLASLVDGRFSILPSSDLENANIKTDCCASHGVSTTSAIIPKESQGTGTLSATSSTPQESVSENGHVAGNLTRTRSMIATTSDTTMIITEEVKENLTSRVSSTAEAIFGGRLSYGLTTTSEILANKPLPDNIYASTTTVSRAEDPWAEKDNTPSIDLKSSSIIQNQGKLPSTRCGIVKSKSASRNNGSAEVTQAGSLPPARRPSLKSGLNGSQGSSYLQTKSRSKEAEEIPTHEQIMHRAANLLRESLDVDYTIFLDVIEDFTATGTSEESNVSSTGSDDERPIFPPRQDSGICMTLDPDPVKLPIRLKRPSLPSIHSSRSSFRKDASAKVLSFSSQTSSMVNHDEISPQFGFRSPACKQLRRLLKRYPEGKLWTFNDNGVESSDDEDTVDHVKNASMATKLSETRFLTQCFPGARQILYSPLFNVEKSIYVSACFCVCLEATPIFTAELELSFLRAFMNNVSVACNRSSMAAANRLKGDFISSISHVRKLHYSLLSTKLILPGTPLTSPRNLGISR